MTGVGVAAGATELGDLVVEMRSVNGRGLVVKPRLAPEVQGMEAAIERVVRDRLQRGTVVVVVERRPGGVASSEEVVDRARAELVARRLRELCEALDLEDEPRLADVLAVPGVLRRPEETRSRLSTQPPAGVRALLEQALDALVEAREAEGRALVDALRAQARELEGLVVRARALAPRVVERYRERLLRRVNEFLADRGQTLSEADVVREVALFADRADVEEELERLEIHLQRLDRVLAEGGPVGRSLDFLLQEMLREANTLGSKSPDAEMAQLVVDMKTAIDRLKEQAANLE